MELWIRSQDKDILLKTNSLLVDDNNNDIYTQDFIGENLTTYTLGRYKSKERALEVLDEIQNKLISYLSEFNDSGITLKEVFTVVYEMPEV